MRYLVAPDSFKGTLTALHAANTIAAAIKSVDATAELVVFPLSDGGEGFLDVVRFHAGGDLVPCRTLNPLREPINTAWLYHSASSAAYIESATCLGLTLIPPEKRNPRFTSSDGLALIIKDVAAHGCNRLLIGLGGSATNDCGYGVARVLGYTSSIDTNPDMISTLARTFSLGIPSFDCPASLPDVHILTDVSNPLLGPEGATYTYAKQKGATPHELQIFDDAVRHFSSVIRRDVRDIDPSARGTGAAGGLGFALTAFLRARIVPGMDFMVESTGFSAHCRQSDIIITGEGQLDEQTCHGKVVHRVASEAAKHCRPVVAFAGKIAGDREQLCEKLGLRNAFALGTGAPVGSLSLDLAEKNLARAVREAFREHSLFRKQR